MQRGHIVKNNYKIKGCSKVFLVNDEECLPLLSEDDRKVKVSKEVAFVEPDECDTKEYTCFARSVEHLA